jgi:hypothetical protein
VQESELEVLGLLRKGESVALDDIDDCLTSLLNRTQIIELQLGDQTRKEEMDRREYARWRLSAVRARQITLDRYRELKKFRAKYFIELKLWEAKERLGAAGDIDPDLLLGHCKKMIAGWARQGVVTLDEDQSAVLDLVTEYLSLDVAA